MRTEVATILWKELRQSHRQRLFGIAEWQFSLAAAGVLGLAATLNDPGFMASAAGVMAGGVGIALALLQVADGFAGERERRTLEALFSTPLSEAAILLGKVGFVTAYGVACALAFLATALATMWATMGGELTADPRPIAAGMTLSLPVLSAIAMTGALISLRSATVKQAQMTLMAIFGGVTVGVAFVLVGFVSLALSEAAPEWLHGMLNVLRWLLDASRLTQFLVVAAALVVLNGVLFAYGLARFERDRLTVL